MSRYCRYVSPDGTPCKGQDEGNGLCYWHDPQANKQGVHLSRKLESYVRSGGMTQGLQLKRADLKGVNLVNENSKQGYDFSYSDFYRCDLREAHLFSINLRKGSLMKANLCDANLHCANLQDTNLLAMKLTGTRIDTLHLGDKLMQEKQAQECLLHADSETARDNFEQAEEIYRNLRKCAEREGLYEVAGQFSYKEQVMRRHLLPRWSSRWVMSHLIDKLCGYGEKPQNTVFFSLTLIFFCACAYFVFGVRYYDDVLQFDPTASAIDNLKSFALSLYYSIVTFTTLGYGDITPFGITRLFAVLEAFIGSFTIALFVVVFVKRINR